MMIWVLIASTLALGVVAFRINLKLIDLHKELEIAYAEAAHEFYALADRILDDQRVGGDLHQVIANLNDTINDRRTAAALLRMLRQRQMSERRTAVNKLPAEIDVLFQRLYTSWFIAVTASSPFLGSLARMRIRAKRMPDVIDATSAQVSRGHKQPVLAA